MILAEHLVTLDANKTFRVYPIGDMHATLRTFDETRFRRYIKTIADDPAGVAIVMGDVSDARSRDHKFFAPGMVHPRFAIEDVDILEAKVAEYATELLAPLGDKLVGFLRGNHHQAAFTHTLKHLYYAATKHMPYDLGDRCMVRVKAYMPQRDDARFSYTVFAQHVTSGGRKPGAQVNQQIDNLASFDADLFLFAHSHKPIAHAHRRAALAPRGALRLLRRHVVFITANAWVADVAEGANSYSDEKGLPTTSDLCHYAEVAYVHTNNKHDVTAKYVVWD